MLNNAVNALLEAYDKDEDINDIRKKRKIVDEKLKFFTTEQYSKRLTEIERLQSENENINNTQLNRRLTEFEIYKIQYETYQAMNDDIERYDKLKKKMEREIKKTKKFSKDVIEMESMFENMTISWGG